MAPEEYRKKRDFKKTPEPEAVPKKKSRELFFRVQKHLASSLHYDLGSSTTGSRCPAVPKGPSLTLVQAARHARRKITRLSTANSKASFPKATGRYRCQGPGTWTPETEDVEAALKGRLAQLNVR
jgi:bifunctional non-homologous end joining protein LigD